MRVRALLVSAPLFLVGAAKAQCLDTTGGSAATLVPLSGFTVDDESRSAPVPLGFAFPMAGAASPSYTHAVIESNGVLYLTNGGAATGMVNFGAGGLGDLRGVAGASPRVFPLWTDLEGVTGNWAITVDTSVAGRFKVNWIEVEEYFSGGPVFSCSASLFSTGFVEFSYGTLPTLPNFNLYAAAGISVGNLVGTGSEVSSDLTASPDSGALGLLFQEFAFTVPSVSEKSIQLAPNLTGGFTASVSCQAGEHASYGAGCYGDSVYELFPDAAAASAALQGNSLLLTQTGTGYAATWIPGGASAYVTPVGATDIARTDDGQALLDLAAAGLPSFPYPGGSTSSLWVHSNGFVSTTGAANDNGAWNPPFFTDYEPSPSFRNAPETAFWAWHDWDPSDTAGGPIRWHYDAGLTTLYITWDGVENYSVPTSANPSRFQFQFNLSTGDVQYVWVTVDANTTSNYGTAHVVGYSPGGASADPGSISFPDAGGTVTINGQSAIGVSASPPPQILPGGSSNPMVYTLTDIPDAAPPSGVRLAILVFSVAPLPGIDIGFIGAPGCQLNIASFDVMFPISGVGSATQTLPLTYPPPLAPGLSFYSQAIGLFPGGSLPGGLNALGVTTSNGLRTTF